MNTTTDNTSSSPLQTLPDSYFATINGENYQDRHAREAREDFERIKARAYKLKAEAHAAVIEAGIELARVKAYEAHLEDIKNNNALHGTNYNPHPYSSFGWEECMLCHNEIRDDPYGHNAAPLADGICCKACNQDVIAERMKGWLKNGWRNKSDNEAEEEYTSTAEATGGDWEWCSGCDTMLNSKDLKEGKKCPC